MRKLLAVFTGLIALFLLALTLAVPASAAPGSDIGGTKATRWPTPGGNVGTVTATPYPRPTNQSVPAPAPVKSTTKVDLASSTPTGSLTVGYPGVTTYPACANEDGPATTSNCVWDALKRGNGVGQSYVLLTNGGQVNLSDVYCSSSRPTGCRQVVDASTHYNIWVKQNGGKVGAYDYGYTP